MFQHLKRHLMTEVDAGSGNGAVVPAATTQPANPPQAQGDAITLSKADLDALVASAATKAVSDAKDSIFAEARRTFTGKQNKTKTDDAPPAPPPPPQLDPIRLRSLDRELNKMGIASKLSDSQYQRVEKMFAMESPDDVSGWVKDYFDGWGNAATPAPQVATAPVTQPVTQTQPQTRTAPPVSDRGSPPVSSVPLEEQDIFSMSPSDREALQRQKGMKWYTDRVLEQSKRHSYKLR